MSEEIQEFEDSEEPCYGQGEGIGTEIADEEEIEFLDGLSELASLQSELFEVRGRLAESRSNGEYVPLKLYRSHCYNSLSVSDLQSGMWCERQLEYRYLHPHMKKTEQWKAQEKKKGEEIKKRTPVMLKGSSLHEKKELQVHERVVVCTKTREDKWAVQLLNTYKQLAIVKEGNLEREISVFGDLFGAGILVNGIIDELQYSIETEKLTLTDLKTRKTNTIPGETQLLGHKLQLMVYKILLDGLTRGSTKMELLAEHLKLNFATQLSTNVIDYIISTGLQSVFSAEPSGDILKLDFEGLVATVSGLIRGLDLPPVTSLVVHYESQETGKVIGEREAEFEEGWAREMLDTALQFWRGEREPTGPEIEDSWKCEKCQFRNVCVWKKQKDLEVSPGVKILNSPVKSPAVKLKIKNSLPNDVSEHASPQKASSKGLED